MLTADEFIKEAKRSIIYANVLPKSQQEIYTRPGFIWASSYTLQYRLSGTISFDDEELLIQNLGREETYVVVEYAQIQSFCVKPVLRVSGVFQTHMIEFYVKSHTIDLQVETRDVNHILKLCMYLHHAHVDIEDPCGIVKLLIKYKDQSDGYYEYMINHYRDMAKLYHLDLPRVKVDRT